MNYPITNMFKKAATTTTTPAARVASTRLLPPSPQLKRSSNLSPTSIKYQRLIFPITIRCPLPQNAQSASTSSNAPWVRPPSGSARSSPPKSRRRRRRTSGPPPIPQMPRSSTTPMSKTLSPVRTLRGWTPTSTR